MVKNPFIFESSLGTLITMFIKQKQVSGYDYYSSSLILNRFDSLIADKFPEATDLTKEMCDAWIEMKAKEHPNGLLRRITPIRQLGKYLNAINHTAYIIPGHIPNKVLKYDAHIYTTKELTAFFRSIDSCHISPFSPVRHYVIPVYFRVLYCCGLRPSEARLLKVTDVDIQIGKLTIRESKGWKSRIIYVADDLLKLLGKYNSIMDSLLPNRDAFFPNRLGNFYSKSTIDCWFHEFWDLLPESKDKSSIHFRVYNFRHTFAVNRLNSWVKEGKNINVLYPYLSEYMGHSSFVETDYYLSLVEEFYPQMERMMNALNENILPEVYHEKK